MTETVKGGDSMIIVIDIGNSHVDISGIHQNKTLFTGEVDTNRDWGEGEYISALRPILQGKPCEGAIVSSVVPSVTQAVRGAAKELLGMEPMCLTEEAKTGLTLALPEKQKLGKDRLADAAWAAANFPLPAVTADLGTATTLNLILPGGVFAGGIICAGIQTSLNALAQHTDQLPALKVEHPQRLVGRNTQECMLSGAVRGAAAMVDGLVRDIEAELGTPVTLLLTGGGGKYVTEYMRHPHTFDPEMTRKGLALIYQMNAVVSS